MLDFCQILRRSREFFVQLLQRLGKLACLCSNSIVERSWRAHCADSPRKAHVVKEWSSVLVAINFEELMAFASYGFGFCWSFLGVEQLVLVDFRVFSPVDQLVFAAQLVRYFRSLEMQWAS
ncbi:hypothetical protein U1Q18_021540 [Sarracenia purpurea var. burkii]